MTKDGASRPFAVYTPYVKGKLLYFWRRSLHISGIRNSNGNFHCRLFDDTHRLVEAITLGRENAFMFSGEPGRENLISILFNLDFIRCICYATVSTRRKGEL